MSCQKGEPIALSFAVFSFLLLASCAGSPSHPSSRMRTLLSALPQSGILYAVPSEGLPFSGKALASLGPPNGKRRKPC
jgi:hypothetical protein